MPKQPGIEPKTPSRLLELPLSSSLSLTQATSANPKSSLPPTPQLTESTMICWDSLPVLISGECLQAESWYRGLGDLRPVTFVV